MAKLIILVGIPGCGKSRFAREIFDLKYSVIETDAIRKRITGSMTDQTENDEVFREFHERIYTCLIHGIDVVADSTALSRDARQTLSKLAFDAKASVHVILFKNIHEALWRNRTRDRKVPDDVMDRMVNKYEQTLLELAQEKYDSIVRISSYGGVT